MAVKTIDRGTVDIGTGLQKEVASGAEKMLYDILQDTQYSYPIQSTVRELTTNALDSQREKEIALAILEEGKPASDFYISRDGAQYADSNWDPTYHDITHLNKKENSVLLHYKKTDGTEWCDTFSVTDHGVGIGKARLKGATLLGFSTKRNTTHNFGAYGLGAKAALSTKVPMYTIDTVHNGRRYRLNCYPYKTVSAIPAFNLNTGQENPFIEIPQRSGDPLIVHYEETDLLNRTTVSFNVKRHNRQAFENAVKEQLLYLNGIRFTVEEEDGSVREVPVQAPVFYNSRNLIFSQTTLYSSPHIVIVKSPEDETGINYGAVDFKELELEEMFGAIGFKCPIKQSYRDEEGNEIIIQPGVSTTPSRERVIWDDNTKAYVQEVIRAAATEAEEMLNKELSSESDFLTWMIKTAQATSLHRSDSTILGRMSRLVNSSQLSPSYPGDKELKFNTDILGGAVFDSLQIGKTGDVITHAVLPGHLGGADKWVIYYKDANYSQTKNAYIRELHSGENVLIFRELSDSDLSGRDHGRLIARTQKVLGLLKPHMRSYADLEVPESFLRRALKAEEEGNSSKVYISPEERRKLNNSEVGYSFRKETRWNGIVRDKVEFTFQQIMDSEDLIYLVRDHEVPFAETIINATFDYHETIFKGTRYWFNVCPSVRVYNLGSSEDFSIHKGNGMINFLMVSEPLYNRLIELPTVRCFDALFHEQEGNVVSIHPVLKLYYTSVQKRVKEIMEELDVYEFPDNLFKGQDRAIYERALDFIHKSKKFREIDSLTERIKEVERYNAEVAEITGGTHLDPMPPQDELQVEALSQLSFRRFIFTDVHRVDVRDRLPEMILEDLAAYFDDPAFVKALHSIYDRFPTSELQIYLQAKGKDKIYWSTEVLSTFAPDNQSNP